MSVEYTFNDVPSNMDLMRLSQGIKKMKIITSGSITGIDIRNALSEASETGEGSLKFTVATKSLQWKAPGDTNYGEAIILSENNQGRFLTLFAENETLETTEKGLIVFYASFSSLPAIDQEFADLACSWRLSNKTAGFIYMNPESDPATSDLTWLKIQFGSDLDSADQTALQSWVDEVAGV